ncbi:MAG: molybdopterin-dependent oxidoreductase, partial [Rhodospirillales bacterium]|nr:molybdopterin-dependent oxidoreductase [Rhodospirillales bacterium]
MASASLDKNPNVDDWLSVSIDNLITVRTGKVDIGQRVSTALAMIAAEELDIGYDRIHVERTQTVVAPDEGVTSGSNSMEHSANAVREASATARRHMLALAADALQVGIDSLEVADGLITSRNTNRSTTYGELMGGKTFGVPVDAEARIKAPGEHKIVGTQVVPKGLEDIVTGKLQYVHDMTMEGMVHARVVRPPHYHARLKSLNEDRVELLRKSGVRVVVNGSFVAVAHEDEYQAIKARDRMSASIEWDPADGLPVQDLYQALTTNNRVSRPVIKGVAQDAPVPELGDPPAEAVATLNARYEKPYIMHGSIGPSAAMAVADNSKLNIWSHSQGIYILRGSTAEALGMDPQDVIITHVPGPGCYGHNGADDVAFDAALVARALPGTPVLLKWTREDEHAWEPYGSAMVMELRGSLDGQGNVIDWSHDTYSDTHSMRPNPGPGGLGPGRLLATRYMDPPLPPTPPQPSGGSHNGKFRNQDPLYTFPNRRIVKHMVEGLPLRCSALRALGGFGNVFALESFMDELAEDAGVDAVEFRLKNLADPRAKAVIQAAAQKFGWPG